MAAITAYPRATVTFVNTFVAGVIRNLGDLPRRDQVKQWILTRSCQKVHLTTGVVFTIACRVESIPTPLTASRTVSIGVPPLRAWEILGKDRLMWRHFGRPFWIMHIGANTRCIATERQGDARK